MYNVPIARNVCATCKWWHGGRKVTFAGRNPAYVTVDGITPRGHGCTAWGKEMGATHTCFRYARWEKL